MTDYHTLNEALPLLSKAQVGNLNQVTTASFHIASNDNVVK